MNSNLTISSAVKTHHNKISNGRKYWSVGGFVRLLMTSLMISLSDFLLLVGQTVRGTDLSKEWNCMGSMGCVFNAGSGW